MEEKVGWEGLKEKGLGIWLEAWKGETAGRRGERDGLGVGKERS